MSVENVATEETSVTLDLTTTFPLNQAMSPDKLRLEMAKSQAIVVWLQTFHIPTLYRKQGADMQVTNPEAGKVVLVGSGSQIWQKEHPINLEKDCGRRFGKHECHIIAPNYTPK
jgi:hypothetical protein